MREIVLDTETTGLDPAQGHRLVEIGAVEIVNQIATGAVFHALINPEREVPEEAPAHPRPFHGFLTRQAGVRGGGRRISRLPRRAIGW